MAAARQRAVVGSAGGLHSRAATLLVSRAVASGHRVTLRDRHGQDADASSILAVLSLGVAYGDDVTIEVEGDEADRVAQYLAELVRSNVDTEIPLA